MASDRDLIYCVNDNMNTLDDCKKISDVANDSARKVKEHIINISSRLRDNNSKIARILSKFVLDASGCSTGNKRESINDQKL